MQKERRKIPAKESFVQFILSILLFAALFPYVYYVRNYVGSGTGIASRLVASASFFEQLKICYFSDGGMIRLKFMLGLAFFSSLLVPLYNGKALLLRLPLRDERVGLFIEVIIIQFIIVYQHLDLLPTVEISEKMNNHSIAYCLFLFPYFCTLVFVFPVELWFYVKSKLVVWRQ